MTHEPWRTRLLDGLQVDDLVLQVQPIVDLVTGALRGAESFSRLRDGSGGFVSPLDWIPLAERSGAIVECGRLALPMWVEAAERLAGAIVSYNLSGRQLLDNGFVDAVLALPANITARLAVEVHVLQFDVARGAALMPSFEWTDVPDLDERLAALRRAGVEVWLDDLGEVPVGGADPLDHPQVDRIKLDRALLASDAIDGVAAMVDEAGKRSMVEGVETDADERVARRAGVEWAQGFRYGWSSTVEEVAGRFGR